MNKPSVSPEEILAAIDACMQHGSANVMRDQERQRGHVPVSPGEVPWLPASIWPQDIVVSLDGPRVRIVAIYTPIPGQGHLSRLVNDILHAGLIPTVVAPMGVMVQILQRWGWHQRVVGSTFHDRCDEWFPTRKWRDERVGVRKPDDPR